MVEALVGATEGALVGEEEVQVVIFAPTATEQVTKLMIAVVTHRMEETEVVMLETFSAIIARTWVITSRTAGKGGVISSREDQVLPSKQSLQLRG